MNRSVAAVWGGFSHGFRSTVRDYNDLLSRALMIVFIVTAMSALWHTALGANGGVLDGYDLRSITWYVLGAQLAVNAVPQRLIETIGIEIGDGSIATAMLRPVSVFGLRFAIDLGGSLARLVGLVPVGLLLTLLLDGPPPSLAMLPLALVAIVLGTATNLACQHILGATSFWLRDAKAGWFLFQKVVFLPGGMLIPLELLPGAIANPCRALPFAAMAYVPGRIASGHFDVVAMATQVVWLGVLMLGAALIYSLGLRRLQTVGA